MKRCFALLVALALCLPPLAGAETISGPAAQKLSAAFGQYDTLGASVAIFQNGQITYTYCYGVERIAGADITPDTAFQVGSISKMVANMGLMQLLTSQGLSLDTELGDVLGFSARNPAYPNTPVTLRQVMTHTSSLRDGGSYQSALDGHPLTLETLFSKRADRIFDPEHEPGSYRNYSNFGGGLIGSLIEKLSGQTVDAYLQANLFAPLGITAAFQPALMPGETRLAALYHMPERRIAKDLKSETHVVIEPDFQRHYTYTAGKLIISAPDLAKLLIVLCDGGMYGGTRVLKESAVGEITTRQDFRGSVICQSGNGLFLNMLEGSPLEGRTLYGHGGKANGMLCAAYFDPADRTGVVMLTNGCRNDGSRDGMGMLARLVTRICYEQVLAPRHTVQDPFAVD